MPQRPSAACATHLSAQSVGRQSVKLTRLVAAFVGTVLGCGSGASSDLVAERLRAFQFAPLDRFSWTLQLPSHGMFESDDRGATTQGEFLSELRSFDWRRMVDHAHELQGPAATFTLRHGGLDRYLAISPAGAPGRPEDLVFFLFWAPGSTGEDPRFLPIDDLAKVEALVGIFFASDVAQIDEIFGTEGLPMEAAFGLE